MLSEESLCALSEFLKTMIKVRAKHKRTRTMGVNPISKRRRRQGDGHNLLRELKLMPDFFESYTRLNLERFEYLVQLVSPLIEKKKISTVIPVGHRLSMTLRYLAVGDQFSSLGYSYRCGESTARTIIFSTIEAIVEVLFSRVMADPSTTSHWLHVAEGFRKKTGVPHCLGALDGKLVRIRRPQNNGDNFMCYKKLPAIVLMALVASDYSFLMVDVGAEGSISDRTVLRRSVFWQKLKAGQLNLPQPHLIDGSKKTVLPYYFIGDRGFPLEENLITPYASKKLTREEAIFNYRLCQARVYVENAFGILTSRWNVFQKPLTCSLERADMIVLAAVCLHNFIIRSSDCLDEEDYIVEGVDFLSSSANGVWPVKEESTKKFTYTALEVRDKLKEYVNGEGATLNQVTSALQGYWGSRVPKCL